jgi:hypothetical protein
LKLGKLGDRLHILEERVAAVARTVVLPAADNQNSSSEVSAPAELSSCRMGTEGSRHSDGGCKSECDHSRVDRVDVFPSLCGVPIVCNNEINGRVAGQGTCIRVIFSKIYACQNLPTPINKIVSIFL